MMKSKNIIPLLFLFLLSAAFTSMGQTIPGGMNYQAIARDAHGELLINSSLTLKIQLQGLSTPTPGVYFTEMHKVQTNQLGLFNLVIGKGEITSGTLNSVPWSTENIWMEVAIKLENETDFTRISSTQLFAVPYAYYARSASQLLGYYNSNPGVIAPGSNVINTPVPANSWQTTGNSATNPPVDYFGTSDCKDLVFKTNAIERMRIFCNGDIFMNNNLNIGVDLIVNRDATINRDMYGKANLSVDSDLTVKKNVNFNTTGGATTVMGPFTVANVSPSVLSGSLRVDSATTMNDSLIVTNNKPTLLTGTLRVNGVTDLYSSFSVNSQAPSYLTGTLRTDSDVTFKSHLVLDNYNWNSQDSATGALVVGGGAGIGRNLNVGGNAKISGKTSLNGQVKLTDTRPAELPDSGALVVSGGVGVGKEISVRKYTRFNDSLIVEGKTFIDKSLVVADSALFDASLNVTGKTQINGLVHSNKQVTITASSLSSAAQNDYNNYPLQVQGGKQGIAVTVDGSGSLANNYVAFFDNSNTVLGRIESFTLGEFSRTSEYQLEAARLAAAENFAILEVINTTAAEVAAIVKVVAAASSSTGCVGLGACATAPVPSLIVASLLNVAAATVNLAAASVKLSNIQTQQSAYLSAAAGRIGVTYESGAGDYAEYLPVLDAKETFSPGDIIGVFGGKISKRTEGAEKIMVISRLPVVLGNMPSESDKASYQKVAFLGQVALQVIGKVNPGDYILADGNNSGYGIAVNPREINSADLKNIAGIAWAESKSDVGISLINTAIGLNINDNHIVIENLKKSINNIKTQLASSDRMLSSMVPGYRSKYTSAEITDNSNPFGYSFNIPNASTVGHQEIPKEQVEAAIQHVLNRLETSTKESDLQFLAKLKENPSIRQQMTEQMYTNIRKQFEVDKKLINELSK
jgi:hypothetical protein